MVSYKEIEEWIFGKKLIDLGLLKRNAIYGKGYQDGEKHDEIKNFWTVIEEMTQEERRKFIRFCYAQSTIPPNDEEFRRR